MSKILRETKADKLLSELTHHAHQEVLSIWCVQLPVDASTYATSLMSVKWVLWHLMVWGMEMKKMKTSRVPPSGGGGEGGLGNPFHQEKWLVALHVLPTALTQKCWYCNFHAVFGHFAEIVSPSPPSTLFEKPWHQTSNWIVDHFSLSSLTFRSRSTNADLKISLYVRIHLKLYLEIF